MIDLELLMKAELNIDIFQCIADFEFDESVPGKEKECAEERVCVSCEADEDREICNIRNDAEIVVSSEAEKYVESIESSECSSLIYSMDFCESKRVDQEKKLRNLRKTLESLGAFKYKEKCSISAESSEFQDDLPILINQAGKAYYTVGDMIESYLKRHRMNASTVCKRTGISTSTMSRIMNIDYDFNPVNKYLLIRLAIYLKMTFDECKVLINKVGYTFTNLSPVDKVLVYEMQHGVYDLYEIDEQALAVEKEFGMKSCGFVPKGWREDGE